MKSGSLAERAAISIEQGQLQMFSGTGYELRLATEFGFSRNFRADSRRALM